MLLARLANSINVAALCLWTGVLVMSGASAAVIFPAAKAVKLAIADMAVPPEEQWRLAGGMIAAKLFFIADVTGFVCALIGGVTLAVLVVGRQRLIERGWVTGFGLGLRILTFAAALVVLCYQLFMLAPVMDSNLKAYWSLAHEGKMTEAATYKAAFDADHPKASATLSTLAGLLVLASVTAVWTGGWSKGRPDGSEDRR